MSTIIRKFFAISLLMPLLWGLAGSFSGCAAGPQEPDQPGPTATTTIYGQVVDEAGTPLSGVAVTAHGSSVTTDKSGLFVLKNVIVPESRLVVTAKKTGFFTSARAETPKAGGATRTKLFMMSNLATYSVSASSGGAVNVTGGASLQFQGGSFQTSSGAAYSGTVNVAARYLDPANPNFGDFFAGDDLAQTSDGSEVGLISCGVLRVEISGQNGEALKLDASKPATISYPKPTSNPTAPSSMPLWYFDETLGMWKEEGTATLQGGKYVGTVTHFSDWNLDYQGDFGTLQFRVTCNGAGIEGVAVKIGGFDHKTGYTSTDGSIRFIRVPADKEIEIFIRAEDNKGLYFINVPVKAQLIPSQLTIIPDIALNSPCPAMIQGTLVGCEDDKAEGLVSVVNGTNTSYTYTKTGDFSVIVPSGASLTVNATDVAGNNATPVDVLPLAQSEQRNLGNIRVCGPNTVQFWDIDLGATGNTYPSAITFSPDGSLMAVLLSDGKAQVYETATRIKTAEFTMSNNRFALGSIGFSADNKRLVISGLYANIDVFDLPTASKLFTITEFFGGAYISDDGATVLGLLYGSEGIGVYSGTDGSLIRKLTPTNYSYTADSMPTHHQSVGYLRAENAIAYFDKSNNLRIWDIATNAELRMYPGLAPGYTTYSDDGERLSRSDDNKSFAVYTTSTGTPMITLSLTGLQGTKASVFLTKNSIYGSEYAGGGRVINTYSLTDGSIKGTRFADGVEGVKAISVNRNEDYLGALTQTNVRLWKLK